MVQYIRRDFFKYFLEPNNIYGITQRMQIHWMPGIGDPTLMGWVTVAAYFTAFFFSVACAMLADNGNSFENAAIHRRLWWFIALMLLVLGINKQLDFQTLITEVGRVLAKRQGWYEQRKTVLAFFVAAIACGCIYSLWFIWRTVENIWKKNRLALVGMVFLVSFILIRATSSHGVDRMLGLNLSGIKMNCLLELGGIALIWISSLIHLNRGFRKTQRVAVGKSIFL